MKTELQREPVTPRDAYGLARHYHDLGFSVIPITPGTKKPAIARWKVYQTRQPTIAELREWFADHPERGIGLILGTVSGDCVVRDFDTPKSYEAWKTEHRDLAATLPTVKTARGFHVYLRAEGIKTKDLGDGELRGEGSYVLTQPTIHPDSGEPYEWIIPLDTRTGAPEVDLGSSGLAQSWDASPTLGVLTDDTDGYGRPHISLDRSGEQVPITPEVQGIIELTQPGGIGVRHRKLFELARRLRRLPGFAGRSPMDFADVVRAWHKCAKPRIGTQPFDESWFEFLAQWRSVKFLTSGETVGHVLAEALKRPLPAVALRFEDDRTRQLIALCRELQQRAGKEPFFLSARTVENIFGMGRMTAWKFLRGLEAEGILDPKERGGPETMKATRYYYLGGD